MNKSITLIIMAAGDSTRFRGKCNIKKTWLRIDDKPMWLYVADNLSSYADFAKVIVTANSNEVSYMKRFCDYEIVCGGKSRQESLQNALEYVDSEFVAVSDAARFGLDDKVLKELFTYDLNNIDCLLPTLNVADSAMLDENGIKYLKRENLRLVQTPQISRVSTLKKALKLGDFSDEGSAINAFGGVICTIKGSKKLNKLTFLEDLEDIMESNNVSPIFANLANLSSSAIFVGYGFDVHKFCKDRQMILGGVKIECEFGFEAHSDGDVLIHALMDSLLGGIGAGDIGEWFPPNDDRFKNADSTILLKEVVNFVESVGFEIVNIDIMILAEMPKITPYKDRMIENLSKILSIPKYRLNIKATTMEKMGFIGRGEGVCVSSNASLKYKAIRF